MKTEIRWEFLCELGLKGFNMPGSLTWDGIRASSSGLREVSPNIGATALPKSEESCPGNSDPSPELKKGLWSKSSAERALLEGFVLPLVR